MIAPAMLDPKSMFGLELSRNKVPKTMPAKKIGTKITAHEPATLCQPGKARNLFIGTTMFTIRAAARNE